MWKFFVLGDLFTSIEEAMYDKKWRPVVLHTEATSGVVNCNLEGFINIWWVKNSIIDLIKERKDSEPLIIDTMNESSSPD
jgi:hypothetical protein